MVRPRTSPEATPILQLLSDYSFDVDTYAAEVIVTAWLQRFEPAWVSQAITEALYQGRYKLVSVDHILQIWQRRGQPLRHFNREFESIILGQSFNQIPTPAKPSPAPLNFTQEPSTNSNKQPQPENPSASTPTEDSPWLTSALSSVLSNPEDSVTQPGSTQPWESQDWMPTPADLASPVDGADLESPVWPSSRTIPPLTPDQLARLTQQPLASVPVAPASTLVSSKAEPPIATAPLHDAPSQENQEPPTVEHSIPADADLPGAELSITVAAVASPSAPTRQIEAEPDSPNSPEAIPNFQPIAPPTAFTPEPTDTIPTFVPASGSSELHQRLKAVVEAGLAEN